MNVHEGSYSVIHPHFCSAHPFINEATHEIKLHCRCLSKQVCKACKYKETGQENCLLINQNSTEEEGQLFEKDENSTIYKKGKSMLLYRNPVERYYNLVPQHHQTEDVKNILNKSSNCSIVHITVE